MQPLTRQLLYALVLCVPVVLAPALAMAAGEQHEGENEAPESVDDYRGPFGQFRVRRIRAPLIQALKNAVKGTALEDSELTGQFRSYYMHGKLKSNARREAWVYGGWLGYRSGAIGDRLRVGTTFFTSQPAHAPSDRDGTLLLRPRQRQIAVFGDLFAQLQLAEHHAITAYRQEYNLPYVNRRDIRQIPNRFEGYSITGGFGATNGEPRLKYVAGWLTRIKAVDSDRFVNLALQAGASKKRGMALAGLLYRPTEDFSLGVFDFVIPDLYTTALAQADRKWTLRPGVKLRAVLQLGDQRSVGDDLLGRSFHTRIESGYVALSYRSAILKLGFSSTSGDSGIISPFGSRPSPLSLMINDFDRADEDAWLIGASYDFARVGLPGLSAFVNYARGNDAHDDSGVSIPDQYELDLTVDYRLKRGRLRGLWLRVRGAFIKERDGGESQNELRVIVNYELPLL